MYGGKSVYVKDHRSSINYSQRKRGYLFGRIAADFAKEILVSDGVKVKFAETMVSFSPPQTHGEESAELGFVIPALIRHGGDSLMFCPDVEGPVSKLTLRRIIRSKPNFLVIGGPPLYLTPGKVAPEIIDRGMENLRVLASKIPLMFVEHHIFRSEDGLKKVNELKTVAKSHGNRVMTYAEHLGLENMILEARRQRMFEENPPPPDFQKWMKLSPLRQRVEPPPV